MRPENQTRNYDGKKTRPNSRRKRRIRELERREDEEKPCGCFETDCEKHRAEGAYAAELYRDRKGS